MYITQAAQTQFNEDMNRAGLFIQYIEQLRTGGYYIGANYDLYRAEAGWQDWMGDYTYVPDGEPCSERELNNIDDVQRKMWETFWENAAKEIHKAEQTYSGEFIPRSKVWRKPEHIDIYTFELNNDTYEYTDRGFNGKTYHGWNTRTKEDCIIRDVAMETDEDSWADLGIIISK